MPTKKKQDIILENELKELLGNETIHVLSEESLTGYRHGFITEKLLKEIITDHTDHFYVCGPPPMMDAIMQSLSNLGVSEKLVIMEI